MTSSITTRRFWTVLLAIAGLSLIWRIVFILVWRDGIFIWGDAYFYHESGRQLAEGVGWVNPLEYNIDGTNASCGSSPALHPVSRVLVVDRSAGAHRPHDPHGDLHFDPDGDHDRPRRA